MEKEILNKGYLTNALTDGNGKIYGNNVGEDINWPLYKDVSHMKDKSFYWSEVFVHENTSTTIVRKGMLLANPSGNDLQNYFDQSKVNLND